MFWLVILFILTPAIELALLVKLGNVIGFWPTVGVIVSTGIAGSALTRRQGLHTWRRFQERLSGGELPGKELVDGVIILVAGALLITPGVLTDLVGFIGLLPWTRRRLRTYLLGRFQNAVHTGTRVTFGGAPDRRTTDGQRQAPTGWRGTAHPHPSHRSGSVPENDR